jgi:hypothetical protein
MLIMVLLLMGVIVLMMDCAKKTMRKQHQEGSRNGAGQSLLVSGTSPVRA